MDCPEAQLSSAGPARTDQILCRGFRYLWVSEWTLWLCSVWLKFLYAFDVDWQVSPLEQVWDLWKEQFWAVLHKLCKWKTAATVQQSKLSSFPSVICALPVCVVFVRVSLCCFWTVISKKSVLSPALTSLSFQSFVGFHHGYGLSLILSHYYLFGGVCSMCSTWSRRSTSVRSWHGAGLSSVTISSASI